MSKKSYLILLNLGVVSLILLLLSLINALSFINNQFDFIVRPFSTTLRSSSSDIGIFLNQYTSGGKLQSENFELNKQIIQLKEQLVNYSEIKKENDFLKTNPVSLVQSVILSSVISLNTNGTMLINKGKVDEVKEGEIVLVSQSTVLGRISSVNDFTSTLELIGYSQTPSRHGVSVKSLTEGNEVAGFLTEADDKSSLIVNEILKTNSINPNAIFVTSGADTIYPQGLVVGSVLKVNSSDTQTTKSATLKVDYDTSTLKYVYIMKSNK